MFQYASDTSAAVGVAPVAVVCPEEESQVRECLLLAEDYGVGIVSRGAGTGTTGGAVSLGSSLVLSFENYNRILDIDVDNRVAVVQPGVITGELQKAVEKLGLFYPPDPASLDICTLGGNIAENAGGPRALKYGVTRDYVLGLKGFWADGTPFTLGGKQHKNVAGYDLISLLVGSEGTLAVITEITLKLIPLPRFQVDIYAEFSTLPQALDTLTSVCTSGVSPALAEFMDPFCIEAAHHYLKQPSAPAFFSLIFQVDGFSEDTVKKQVEVIIEHCKRHKAVSFKSAGSDTEKNKLWEIRRCLSLALKAYAKHKVSHDIVVPPSSISSYLETIKTWSTQDCRLLGYGHLGDGNIHVNILNMGLSFEAWQEKEPELSKKVLKLAVDLGGTITGEHGIGLTKKHYLSYVASPKELQLYKAIKQAFDPKNRLNPGKIID